jgi:hypothetical protein
VRTRSLNQLSSPRSKNSQEKMATTIAGATDSRPNSITSLT